MPDINFFDTYYMLGMIQAAVPPTTFFRDRYFGDAQTFPTDKVLAEFREGDMKLAPFVAQRSGDIPVARGGYELLEFTPPFIAPSRTMSIDDLRKRGFGEAMFAQTSHADRARDLQMRDLADLSDRITRREEWMAAQTMINNGLTMQEYIDADTTGEELKVYFYDPSGSNPGLWTVGSPWTTFAEMQADIIAMCDDLASRGQPVSDLLLGSTAWATIKQFEDLQKLLDKQHEFVGELRARILYPGVSYIGQLDFDGFMLDILVPREIYKDGSNAKQSFFPAKGALVTAPGCGQRLYGAIDQIEIGATDFTTVEGQRIPKLCVNQNSDTKKLRVGSRPLTLPKTKAPWLFAANVVS